MAARVDNYGMDLYQQFIHRSRYSRYLDDEQRRETWPETVTRYFDFFQKFLKENNDYKVPKKLREELETAVLNHEVMPSMRALMTAGPALERENLAGYNCSYAPTDAPKSFDELMYILMNGTGAGFSVERQWISSAKLPEVAEDFHPSDITIHVADSSIGWSKAFKELIALLYQGQVPSWDLSRLRGKGAKLKTFGGRSAGPEPLDRLFHFTVNLFKNAHGRKLNSIECHDLQCKIAQIVVVGGVRRSALISLSNLSDDRMRHAKSGQWWQEDGHRSLANNSAVYTEKPDIGIFMEEWLSLYNSKSGERGIINREALKRQVEKSGRRQVDYEFGVNPCGEIILRPRGLCNLSEVVIRVNDTQESIMRKVRLATILGTWQSCLTNFRYVSGEWKKNAEEERLLGVSLTGIMDHPYFSGNAMVNDLGFPPMEKGLGQTLDKMREFAITVNAEFAKKIGINPSVAITTVKPSGTVSQLVNASSGIHDRFAPFYVRTVRGDNKDPLTQFMIDMGIPHAPDVMNLDSVTVFEFPVKSPDSGAFEEENTAILQLKHWLTYKRHWTEHNPSVTITVKEHEWLEVGAWVYENFDEVSGISFLPHTDHIYQQAPYQEITEEEYEARVKAMPEEIDWSKLSEYEKEDTTTGSQELACSAGVCEVVDLTTEAA